jgi:hypothetical protein
MASTASPTATLCHWVCSTRYGDLPAEVRQETVTLLYDQVGCMIASATLPSCQPVVELVRRSGTAMRWIPPASMARGTMRPPRCRPR